MPHPHCHLHLLPKWLGRQSSIAFSWLLRQIGPGRMTWSCGRYFCHDLVTYRAPEDWDQRLNSFLLPSLDKPEEKAAEAVWATPIRSKQAFTTCWWGWIYLLGGHSTNELSGVFDGWASELHWEKGFIINKPHHCSPGTRLQEAGREWQFLSLRKWVIS